MKVSPVNFTSYLWFIALLIIMGGIASYLLNELALLIGIEIPYWIDIPGAIGIAGFIYTLFDLHFWSWKIFKITRILDCPDLRGRWEGEIKYLSDNQNQRKDAVIEIIQSASNIKINLYTLESKSSSVSANFEKDSDGIPVLRYLYINNPNTLSKETMHTHIGAAELRFYEDIKALEGSYFTSHQRSSHGEMSFDFSEKKIYGRYTK